MKIQEQDYIVVSLKHAICDGKFGLCLNKDNHFYEKRADINTELLKLFNFLSNKTWQEVYNINRLRNYGHEHLQITSLLANNIKSHFNNLGCKNKCDIFRFGSQNYRACGYRRENIFYLVCCDYAFNLYKH